MADQSDVENLLVAIIAQAIYPNGTAQPSAIGANAKVRRGWVNAAELTADLAVGTVNITIVPGLDEQNVTRHLGRWLTLPVTPPTLTLTVAGDTVTVGGTPVSPLNACIVVSGVATVYAVQPGDSLSMIATGLASGIGAAASSDGAVVTIANAVGLEVTVGGMATAVKSLNRLKRDFLISLWCNDPNMRDTLRKLIAPTMAQITYLTMPDGLAARIRYERSPVPDDWDQKDELYRADLSYSVEYDTTISEAAPVVVAAVASLQAGGSAPVRTFSTTVRPRT